MPQACPPQLLHLVIHKGLYNKAMTNEDNPEAIASIICHFAWEWIEFTRHIIAIMCDGVDKADFDDIVPFFTVLEKFLGLNDSIAKQRIMELVYGSQHVGVLTSMMRFSDRYPQFSYESCHNVLRLMQLHGAVTEQLLHDRTVVDWMERFLRVYAADPKNAKFTNFSSTLMPPPLPLAEQARRRALLDKPPAELPLDDEVNHCAKLRMPEAERALRTLARLEAFLKQHGLELLGEDEVQRIIAAEKAAAKAAKAAEGGDGDDDEGDDDDDSSADMGPDGGMASLDDDDDRYVVGPLD